MNTSPWENPISTEPKMKISAFEQRKIWLMKVGLKQLGMVGKTLRFLVVADDYGTAKEMAHQYATENTNGKTYVSNVIGNEVAHNYMLMIEENED